MRYSIIFCALMAALTLWMGWLVPSSQMMPQSAINGFDIVSEIVSLALITLMQGAVIKHGRYRTTSMRLMFSGLCFLMVGHVHDLADEIIFVEPTWLAFILENLANNLGLLCIALGILYWVRSYDAKLQVLNEQKEALASATRTDALTNLSNRRVLNQSFKRELEEQSIEGNHCTLALMDLDNFKGFNDTHGHPQGDRLIKFASAIIRRSIRDSDIAVRYGGEEFLLVIRANLTIAGDIAERLRMTYADSEFDVYGDRIAKTMSLGVAELLPGQTFDETLSKADQALYAVKNHGKNRVQTWPQTKLQREAKRFGYTPEALSKAS